MQQKVLHSSPKNQNPFSLILLEFKHKLNFFGPPLYLAGNLEKLIIYSRPRVLIYFVRSNTNSLQRQVKRMKKQVKKLAKESVNLSNAIVICNSVQKERSAAYQNRRNTMR